MSETCCMKLPPIMIGCSLSTLRPDIYVFFPLISPSPFRVYQRKGGYAVSTCKFFVCFVFFFFFFGSLPPPRPVSLFFVCWGAKGVPELN